MNGIPELMPVLAGGKHSSPAEGACVMEYVSLLAGEEWSDSPACTHPVLASVARSVNDSLSDADRQLLIPLIPRLFGTAPFGTPTDRHVLSVRLAVWAAERVHHLVRAQDAEVTRHAIDAARAWADDPTAAYAARDAAAAARDAAAAAYYAANAAAAAYYAANAAANASAARDAATAAYAARDAASAQFLSDLIDQYDRLTGRDQFPDVDYAALELSRITTSA